MHRYRMGILWLTLLLVASLSGLASGAAFHGAWPYQPPPVGHFNTYVTNNIPNGGMYWDFVEMPLAMYVWGEDRWVPLLATSWEIQPPDKFVVKLREGVKWSDGSDFTAQDVITTFETGRLMNWVVWRFVSEIQAPDDHTVVFTMSTPSTVVVRYVLRERIRAHSVYGDFARRVKELVAQGVSTDSDAWNNLRVEFEEFRPSELVVTGPYRIDPNLITEAQYTLVKWDGSWIADKVLFDRIVVYNGETPTVTPLVLAKEVDYATHGFPPATELQFTRSGIRVIRPPTYSGPALYFNFTIPEFNRKEVRQAIAHVINREENGIVSLGASGVAVEYMAGMSDNLVPLWLSEENIARLNRYEHNWEKAEELLRSIGYSRGPDGVWVTDTGKRMEYELTMPGEYADWSAAAENAAEQLNQFGIKVTVRAINFNQHLIDVNEGRFEMAIRAWGAANPHPHFSYVQNLFTHNITPPTGGMKFPMVQETDVLGTVDLEALVVASAEGLDEATHKELVTQLALAYNELLPNVSLWERYGNNPALDGVRVTGWPDDEHPYYGNSPYADAFATLFIFEGILRPAQ